MFEYFYHEILRRTIIAFGTLFNGIEIQHDESDGSPSTIRVPLAYGPTQKFLARLQQSPDLNKPVQITLPRMSFEFVGMQYDGSRKVTTTQTFTTYTTGDKTEVRKAYMPVPYNMAFELSIMTKLNDDMLQIVEQIVPYFQPAFNLSVDLVSTIGEKRDIPVIIESINMQDDYEGDYTTRRVLLYTIRFTAKTYLFGPVQSAAESAKDIIKKVSIGYVADDSTSTTRELAYTVTPRATRSYVDNPDFTTLTADITDTITAIDVTDSSGFAADNYITIDNEELQIVSISGNELTVKRGQDRTIATPHVSGAQVKLLTAADNLLIDIGDDFGFSGTLA